MKRLVLGLLLCAPLSCKTHAIDEQRPSREWTIMLYAAVDNDWESDFMPDVSAMRRGLNGTSDPEVLLLIDRSPKYSDDAQALGEDFADTRLYRLTAGGAQRLSGEPELAGLTARSAVELDTGDAIVLRDFVRWGKRRYPARHFALWLVSHGEGPRCCPDETSGEDQLFTAEITDVLTQDESVDVLGFDACLMAGIENAYQWRRRPGKFGADFLLASASVSSSWPYEEIFAHFRSAEGASSLDARGLCALVVDEVRRQILEGRSGDRGLERDLQSFGSFDLALVADAKSCVDALARRLWKDGSKTELLALRGSGLEAQTFVYVWPERDAKLSMPFVDLAHLCERIAGNDRFSVEARALATRAAEATDLVVADSCGFAHYAGFVPGRHGLYLVFPEGDVQTRSGRSYWEATSWYSPLRVEGQRDAYGRYGWCIDGAQPANHEVDNWFELMDAWFDIATHDAPGGVNGYAW
jgi:clostripain